MILFDNLHTWFFTFRSWILHLYIIDFLVSKGGEKKCKEIHIRMHAPKNHYLCIQKKKKKQEKEIQFFKSKVFSDWIENQIWKQNDDCKMLRPIKTKEHILQVIIRNIEKSR